MAKVSITESHPRLINEWDYNKNLSNPSNYTYGSSYKAWWICTKYKEHSWQASILNRSTKQSGCPYCAGNKILLDSSFGIKYKNLLEEVDPAFHNIDVVAKYAVNKKISIHWLCAKDNSHAWVSYLQNRIKQPNCPYCYGRKPISGVNDLKTIYPELMKEWDYNKNVINPSTLTKGSDKKVWWICKKGHSWSSTVHNRIKGKGCPACARYGFNPKATSVLYFIKNEKLGSFKVGISNINSDRIDSWERSGWFVLMAIIMKDGSEIRTTESILKAWLSKDKGLKPSVSKEQLKRLGGWSETFSINEISEKEVIFKIQSIITSRISINR